MDSVITMSFAGLLGLGEKNAPTFFSFYSSLNSPLMRISKFLCHLEIKLIVCAFSLSSPSSHSYYLIHSVFHASGVGKMSTSTDMDRFGYMLSVRRG